MPSWRSAKMARTPSAAPDFLSDDDAAERGRQHDGRAEVARALRDGAAERLGVGGMLQHERALQVAGTVKPGRQTEVALEQRARAAEQSRADRLVSFSVVVYRPPLPAFLATFFTGAGVLRPLPAVPGPPSGYTPAVPKLSVTIITRNEAAHVADALDSVAWADEIIVVDSESTDDTVAIARRHHARVIVRAWPGYVAQKNYAASIASHDWILSLDADERVTPALAAEMRALLATAPGHAAYRMPRVTWHLGRWIRTTDWYPDYQLRLYDRRTAEWTGRYVHEAVTVRGHRRTTARGASALRLSRHRRSSRDDRSLHDVCRAADARERPPRRRPAARLPSSAGVSAQLPRSAAAFGTASSGSIISAMNSYYVFLKFAKLWELRHTTPVKPRSHEEHEATL